MYKHQKRLNISNIQEIINKIHPSWFKVLKAEFQSAYFIKLLERLSSEDSPVYPPDDCIFAAYNYTPFNEVKVVILGQDPYHNPGQANGLCFSVNSGVKPPPSLKNIYKELNSDLNIPVPSHGNLSSWAKNGVMLLNTVLTVRENQAGSHSKFGWHTFTDATISAISKNKDNVVFILWGKYAQSKLKLIDPEKHFIICSAHPSPLSTRNGFFGSRPFSRTNTYLSSVGKEPVNWEV